MRAGIVRRLVTAGLRHCGTVRLARALRAGIRILAWHGVDSADDDLVNHDGLQTRPEVFEMQVAHLAAHYHVYALAEVIEALDGGPRLRHPAAVITFDDGYRNNLTQAAPVLRRYGLPATFFITTGFVDGGDEMWWYRLRRTVAACRKESLPGPDGRVVVLGGVASRRDLVRRWEDALKAAGPDEGRRRLEDLQAAAEVVPEGVLFPPLSWEDVKRLAAMGFEIGAHTVSHVGLGALPPEELVREIEVSVARLREAAGVRAVSYSFPYGSLPREASAVRAALARVGIKGAVTTRAGLARAGDDVYDLPRLNVGRHDAAAFELLVSGLRVR